MVSPVPTTLYTFFSLGLFFINKNMIFNQCIFSVTSWKAECQAGAVTAHDPSRSTGYSNAWSTERRRLGFAVIAWSIWKKKWESNSSEKSKRLANNARQFIFVSDQRSSESCENRQLEWRRSLCVLFTTIDSRMRSYLWGLWTHGCDQSLARTNPTSIQMPKINSIMKKWNCSEPIMLF